MLLSFASSLSSISILWYRQHYRGNDEQQWCGLKPGVFCLRHQLQIHHHPHNGGTDLDGPNCETWVLPWGDRRPRLLGDLQEQGGSTGRTVQAGQAQQWSLGSQLRISRVSGKTMVMGRDASGADSRSATYPERGALQLDLWLRRLPSCWSSSNRQPCVPAK